MDIETSDQNAAAIASEIAVLAMPGSLGWWLVERVNAAVSAAGRVPRIVTVGMFDDVFAGSQNEHETVIFYAHAPSKGFIQRMQREHMPAIVLVTEAITAVAELIAAGSKPLDAMREVSASASVLDRVLHTAGFPCVTVTMPDTAEDVISVSASVTGLPRESFDFGMPEGESDRVPIDAAILRDSGKDRAKLAVAADLSARTRAHVELALRPIVDNLVPGGNRSVVTWMYDMFYSGDRPGEPAPLLADVVGPARVIFYGPYFHVPDGEWLLRGTFGFSDEVSDLNFMFELLRPHNIISAGWIQPKRQGLFKVEMPISLAVAEHALEVRVHNRTGAIEGRVGMAKVEFIPQ